MAANAWNDTGVVITGGSSGIGEEIALRLARRRARLFLVARDGEKLSAVRDKCLAAGGDGALVETFSCDVSDYQAVLGLASDIDARFGPPRVLINSAGVLSGGYFEDLPLENFRREMDINFFGTLHMAKAFLPLLKKTAEPRIINIASIAGTVGVFGYASYCSSKFAVVGFSETLRAELKPQGIRVQTVLPPEVETPMLADVLDHKPREAKAVAKLMRPMKVEDAVSQILRDVDKGKPVIAPGPRTYLMIWLNRAIPPLGRAAVDFNVKRYYRGPEAKSSSVGAHSTPTHCCPWWLAYTFDNPLRRLVQDPKKIAGPYIEPGMTVVDIGCGMGYFSVPMADMAGPGGKVVTVDLQQEMLDITMARARKKGLGERIQPNRCRPGDLLLDIKADFALAMWMVHEVPDQEAFMEQIFDALNPGAKFLLVEPVMHVKKKEMELSVKRAEAKGFKLLERPRVGISLAALLQKPSGGGA